jgi:P27 family predicted phage terminase small subunit
VLVSLGVLTRADLRSLQLLCETLAHESQLRELLVKEGHLVVGAGGVKKTHPAVKMLETTRNQAHRLLNDFGLTPRARQSVDLPPPTKPGRLASLDLP